jgi:hypothetical protein
MKLIDKSAVVAEIEGLKRTTFTNFDEGVNAAAQILLDFIDTFEVKEVNIAEMADDYYDALMEEASVWMDEGTMVHCRLAYYNGCKDVLNKIQKGE